MDMFSSEFLARATRILAALLLLNYAVFMIGYFILPDYSLHYKYFVRPLHVLAIPGIFLLSAAFRELKDHPVFQLAVVYMLYMLASAAWSEPFKLYESGQKLANATYILAFIVITHLLRMRFPVGFDRMLRFSVLVAAVSAVVALLVFYNTHDFPSERVVGIGALTNVNEFSNVYGVFALLAMGFLLESSGLREKALYLLPVISILCFIWFGQSRTAFASLFVALLVLVIAGSRQDKLKLTVLVIGAAGVLLALFPELVEMAFIRGEGLRPSIWQAALEDVVKRPIFGMGIVSTFSIDVGDRYIHTVHNAYLQALWHGGVVGLGLFLLLITAALWKAWHLGKERGDYVILSILLFMMGAMLAGVDTLVARPRDQWMLVWFPLAMLISYQSAITRSQERVSNG